MHLEGALQEGPSGAVSLYHANCHPSLAYRSCHQLRRRSPVRVAKANTSAVGSVGIGGCVGGDGGTQPGGNGPTLDLPPPTCGSAVLEPPLYAHQFV